MIDQYLAKKLHISAAIETCVQFPAEKMKNLPSLAHLMPVVPKTFYKNPLESIW